MQKKEENREKKERTLSQWVSPKSLGAKHAPESMLSHWAGLAREHTANTPADSSECRRPAEKNRRSGRLPLSFLSSLLLFTSSFAVPPLALALAQLTPKAAKHANRRTFLFDV